MEYLRRIYLSLISMTVCQALGHHWIYSRYKSMNSKRGCSQCLERQTPGDSPEFRRMIIDMEAQALMDMNDCIDRVKRNRPYEEVIEPIMREPIFWGPVAGEWKYAPWWKRMFD